MIAAVTGAVAIVLLVASAPLLIAATTWPAYLLSVLRFSHETAERLERTVVRTSLMLLVAAAGASSSSSSRAVEALRDQPSRGRTRSKSSASTGTKPARR
jgi:hypothetical protein